MDLRALRERMEMTQQEAADNVGVTLAAWSHWERGARVPRPAKAWEIIDLAESYGILVRLEDIFPRNGN